MEYTPMCYECGWKTIRVIMESENSITFQCDKCESVFQINKLRKEWFK